MVLAMAAGFSGVGGVAVSVYPVWRDNSIYVFSTAPPVCAEMVGGVPSCCSRIQQRAFFLQVTSL